MTSPHRSSPTPASAAPRDRPRRRLPWGLHHLVVRPRLAIALAALVAVAAAAWGLTDWRWPTVALTAWNVAALLLIGLDVGMMAGSDERAMDERATLLDDGQEAILALSVLAGLASLVAIVLELAAVKDVTGLARALHVGLAALTVATAWTFIHVMFAMHYAHEYMLARSRSGGPGLRIPDEDHPDYWDFLYVAISIGTSGQTADVEFTSKRMRRIALSHCALAFFFNTTVLALTVNIAAGLF